MKKDMKKEKELIKIVLNNYCKNEIYQFNDDSDVKIIQKLLIKQILSNEAFKEINHQQRPKAEYIQKINIYPLTKEGIEQKEKNLYLKIRDSLTVKILSDIILFIAFILSVFYTLKQVY